MGNPAFPRHLSEKEAAAYLHISLSTIVRRRRDHTGPAFIRFGGVLRYAREARDDFLASNTVYTLFLDPSRSLLGESRMSASGRASFL
jgi:hypothetical protein